MKLLNFILAIHQATAQFFPRRNRNTATAIVATATRSRAPTPTITLTRQAPAWIRAIRNRLQSLPAIDVDEESVSTWTTVQDELDLDPIIRRLQEIRNRIHELEIRGRSREGVQGIEWNLTELGSIGSHIIGNTEHDLYSYRAILFKNCITEIVALVRAWQV